MSDAPIMCVWADGCFRPVNGALVSLANERFGQGEIIPLVRHEDRSERSHNHEFAFVATAWENLPAHLAEQIPSPEHLRKRALIQAGWYDEQIINVGTKASALRTAAAVRSFPGEDFSQVVVRGPLVVIRRAKSQSRRAMGKADFQRSKDEVLHVLAEMLGVEPRQLAQAQAA